MMDEVPLLYDEERRLAALRSYQILDTPIEETFEDLTFFAASVCGVPYAAITFIDEDRIWFKSEFGAKNKDICREDSFCNPTILQQDVLEITNTLADPRFAKNPFVVGMPHVRFYAGVPITTQDGYNIGTICILDVAPKRLTDQQRNMLKRLARQVMSQIEYRLILQKNRQLNQTLSETVRFSKNIIDNIPATIGYWDKNLICRYANKTYAEKYFKQGIEIVGKALAEAACPELMQQIKPHIDGVFKGIPQKFEASITAPNKQVLKTQVNYIPDMDQYGNINGFYIFAHDITALRQAEEENKLAEVAMEISNTGVLITDSRHQIISVNHAFLAMTGYEQQELTGKTPDFLFDNVSTQKAMYSLQAGDDWRGEGKYRKKNGELIDHYGTVSILRNEKGEMTYHLATIADLTEKIKLQQELAITQQMLERTGKIANVGGWEYDFNNNVVRWSDQLYIIRELDTREPPTHEFALSFYQEEARATLNDAFQRCIEDGTPFDLELPIVTAKGNHIWIRTIGEMAFENEKKSKVVGITQDISLRKRQEQLALNKEIELRKAIVREVHHHIKNNIQGLSGILHNAVYQYPSLSTPINEAINHLQSVAVIHGLQGKCLDAAIEMRELTQAICKNIQEIWQTEILFESNQHWVNCHLSKSEAVPIALILNELITNAEKHHVGNEAIAVSIVQIIENENLHEISIHVKNEGNFVFNSNLDQDTEHFGLKLINSLLPKAGAYLYLSSRDSITQATLTLKPPTVKLFNTFLQSDA